MRLRDYTIPRLSVRRPDSAAADIAVDSRDLNLRHFATIYAKRCQHCRNFHSDKTYCFQNNFKMSSRKRHRSLSPSVSEASCSGASGRSDRSDSEVEDGEISAEKLEEESESEDLAPHLKDFFGSLGRVDDKPVTLSLDKQTVKLYFATVLGRGKFDREGREKMRDKYYLDSKQYEKFAPPDLLGTKLHLLEGLDFSGLSSRLQVTHSKLRDVVKVQLKHFQSLGEMQAVFGDLQIESVFDDQGSLNAQYELADMSAYKLDEEDVDRSIDLPSDISAEDIKKLIAENNALKRKDKDSLINYKRVLEELDTAIKFARKGKDLFAMTKELVWDELQLTGQCDVFLSETREQNYEKFLMPAFKDEVRSRAKNPEHRREKFSSNSLFEKTSKLDKTVKDLTRDNTKVYLSSSFFLTYYAPFLDF